MKLSLLFCYCSKFLCFTTVGPLGRESIKSNDLAAYITVSTEDKLNVVITPNLIAIADIVTNAFQQATSGIPIVPTSIKKLNLHNDIGHESRIELLVSEDVSISQVACKMKIKSPRINCLFDYRRVTKILVAL